MLNRPQEEEECKKDPKMGKNNRKCHPLLGWVIGMKLSMFVTTSAMPRRFICKVSKKNIQSFSRNGGTYRETEKQTNR